MVPRVQIKVSAGFHSFLDALGENSLFCLFQLLDVVCISWLVAPSSVIKANNGRSSPFQVSNLSCLFHHHISLDQLFASLFNF